MSKQQKTIRPDKGKPLKEPLEARRTIKGPEPERLKIEGKWEDAVDAALKVKRPPADWPK